jgi:hypothetical protein
MDESSHKLETLRVSIGRTPMAFALIPRINMHDANIV